MSYLVIARKYRPAAFDAVSGQEHVTRTLSNSITRGKIAHAILLTGPRGVGKTSIARIFSKCLNCVEGPTVTPCLHCSNCTEIANGNSIAVREIDGASHNSVDNVRELMESFRSLPAPGSKYKVYIIDEVHMLSTSAFNALLKSLEEPPPHTVFILATTEVHKIPETVISRCQRHDLRAIHTDSIEGRLQFICREEKLSTEPGVLRSVARLADGSMRDAQTLLERLQAFCDDGKLTMKETTVLLGTVEKTILFQLSQSIFAKDASTALTLVQDILATGVDAASLIRDFVSHFRELLLARLGGDAALKRLSIADADCVEFLRQVDGVGATDLQDLAHMARDGGDSALRSSYPKYALEALVARMATREKIVELSDLVDKLRHAGGGSAARAPQQEAAQQRPPVQAAPKTSPSAPSRPAPQATPVQEESRAGGSDWGGFVRFVSDQGSRMLGEHFKRLSIVKFGEGIFEVRGPEFSISYLDKKEQRDKVQNLLAEYSKIPTWKFICHVGEGVGTVEPGSILHMEQSKRKQTQSEKEGAILSHPQMQKLQNAFPGSKIEAIKVKEK